VTRLSATSSGHLKMVKLAAGRYSCSSVLSASALSFIVTIMACHASAPNTSASISKSTTSGGNKSAKGEKKAAKSTKAGKCSQGWILTLISDRYGLARYYFSDSTLKVESTMMVILVDGRAKTVTFGTWETKKAFTFPIDKSKFYTKIMGISSPGKSAFARKFRESAWKQTKTSKIGDMDVVQYERYVLNPPPGRTRTRIQIFGHLDHISPQLLTYYYQLQEAEPAVNNGILVEDRVVITNPSQKWADFKIKDAKRADIAEDKLTFPTGFQKVNTASELFLDGGEDSVKSKLLRKQL
jgi:hypothetical protein